MITDRVHAQAKKRARAERRDKNSSAVDKELKELRTTLQREVAEKEQLRQVSIFVCVLQRGRREGAAAAGIYFCVCFAARSPRRSSYVRCTSASAQQGAAVRLFGVRKQSCHGRLTTGST